MIKNPVYDISVNVPYSVFRDLMFFIKKDRIIKVVVGAMIIKEGKFLILKRSNDENFMAGFDEIVSGHVEREESIIHGLIRETYEETKLQVTRINEYVGSFDYISGSGKKSRQINFLVDTEDSEIILNPHEHCDYKWVATCSDDFLRLNLSPESRQAIIEADSKVKYASSLE